MKLNLKNLFNEDNKGRAFGLLYLYILIIGLAIGLYYLNNLDNVARQEITPRLPDTTTVEEQKIVEARVVPPVNILELKEPTAQMLEKGKELYQTNCASCHGENGTGTGPASVGLNPAPRNFTVDQNWVNGAKLSQIYQTLEEGIAGSGMISYNFLSPEDRIALAQYIRQTFIKNPPEDTDDELLALDQMYSLSQGQVIPAQIPVIAAETLIVRESAVQIEKISKLIKEINSSSEPGAEIFKTLVIDERQVLSAMIKSESWKASRKDFINFVFYNMNTNGFKPRLLTLTENEFDLLYGYLKAKI
ncbi:MAG: hypothetical protein Kow0098_17680 [Ignavibacteriaceae bacterium]